MVRGRIWLATTACVAAGAFLVPPGTPPLPSSVDATPITAPPAQPPHAADRGPAVLGLLPPTALPSLPPAQPDLVTPAPDPAETGSTAEPAAPETVLRSTRPANRKATEPSPSRPASTPPVQPSSKPVPSTPAAPSPSKPVPSTPPAPSPSKPLPSKPAVQPPGKRVPSTPPNKLPNKSPTSKPAAEKPTGPVARSTNLTRPAQLRNRTSEDRLSDRAHQLDRLARLAIEKADSVIRSSARLHPLQAQFDRWRPAKATDHRR